MNDDWSKLPDLIPPMIAGTGMAFILSFLRGLYDSKEPRFLRVLIEACMCSGLTVAAIAGLFLAFPSLASDIVKAVLVGGGSGAFVGFLGVYHIRRYILKILDSKLNERDRD